jgi:hypothetical protein
MIRGMSPDLAGGPLSRTVQPYSGTHMPHACRMIGTALEE